MGASKSRHVEIAREIEFCECQFVTIVIDIIHDRAISVARTVDQRVEACRLHILDHVAFLDEAKGPLNANRRWR
jgi:hypothetical protein